MRQQAPHHVAEDTAVVALANKTVRMAWAILMGGNDDNAEVARIGIPIELI